MDIRKGNLLIYGIFLIAFQIIVAFMKVFKEKLKNTFKIRLKQSRVKNGVVLQKVLQLQPIVDNTIEPDISHNNLMKLTFINIKFFF